MFRQHWGLQFLALVEEVLPRHGSGHHGDWHISLSKPSEKEQHLLMTLVGEQGERGGGAPTRGGALVCLGRGSKKAVGGRPNQQRFPKAMGALPQSCKKVQPGLLDVGWAFRIAG